MREIDPNWRLLLDLDEINFVKHENRYFMPKLTELRCQTYAEQK